MKRSYAWRVMLILLILGLSILALVSRNIPRGIDLQGGAELVFSIDTSKIPEDQRGDLSVSTVDIIRERIDPTAEKGYIVQAKGADRVIIQLPGKSSQETSDVIALATNLGRLEFRLAAKGQDPKIIAALKGGKTVPGFAYYEYDAAMRGRFKEAGAADGLLVVSPDQYNITGELLSRVNSTYDSTGAPAVGFNFRPDGARLFARLTGEHIGDSLAIILNGKVYTAPVINGRISDSGIIEGMSGQKEVDMVIKVLKSGSLKAPLISESEQFVGPSVGENTIRSAGLAAIIASCAVVLFMLVYYIGAGAIADVALALNIVILLGFMAATSSVLTLPGIAGIILTIGMAVDANVLIFERFREERNLGRDLPSALRMAYEKAFSAIFDSNLTTLATGIILFSFGTGPVKGFAVTLSVGIVISFFTAVFVTRTVLDIMVKRNMVKDLKMMRILAHTKIPFMRMARYAIVVSAILIIAGMSFFIYRGDKNLDIDFTGGSVAQLHLTRAIPTSEVRTRLEKVGLGDANVQAMGAEARDITSGGVSGSEQAAAGMETSTNFAIRVQMKGQEALEGFKTKIASAFGDLTEKMAIEVIRESVTPVRAVNDPYYGGFTYQIKLGTSLPRQEVTAGLAGAGLPKHDVTFLARSESGATVALPDSAETVDTLAIKTSNIKEDELQAKLNAAFMVPNPFPDNISQVGSQVAGELANKAVIAVILSWAFIIVYLWFRFGRLSFGLGGVVALIHDVLITLGAIAVADALTGTPVGKMLMLENVKINLPVVAAIMTIIGFSINDTIVIFDRIRENSRLKTKSDSEIIDGSINQTLSRTILTSWTVFLCLIVMYLFGGPGMHGFAFVMLVGTVTGVYSSVAIAAPILLVKDVFAKKSIERNKGK